MSYDVLDDVLMLPNPITEAKIVGDGVSAEKYLAQADGVKRGSREFVISRSDLMEFNNCPHRWVSGYSEDETKATDWGSLVDCFLMDRNAISDRFIILPATYTNEKGETKPWNWNATVCKDWRKEHNAAELKTEVKNEIFFSAKSAAELILADPQLDDLFANSRKQVMITGVYADSETGIRVPVKAALDLVPTDASYLVDLKTANNAHPRAWKRKVFDFGYHVQAAMHMDLWNAATGETRNEFKHVIQENVHPFEVAKRFLSSEYIAIGRRSYIGALKRYAKCLQTNEWPGYDQSDDSSDVIINGWLMVSPEAWMI